ncbi:hypothetical protein BGX26_007065 [Mortierella sp. AD094]|nr:hypothetical protein BGX26_007065 [Mortierella sp. AD094]
MSSSHSSLRPQRSSPLPSVKFDTFDTFDNNDNVIRDFSGIKEKINTVLSLYEKQEQLLDGKAKHLLPQKFLLLPTTRVKPVYEYGDNERWSRLMFQAVIMKSYVKGCLTKTRENEGSFGRPNEDYYGLPVVVTIDYCRIVTYDCELGCYCQVGQASDESKPVYVPKKGTICVVVADLECVDIPELGRAIRLDTNVAMPYDISSWKKYEKSIECRLRDNHLSELDFNTKLDLGPKKCSNKLSAWVDSDTTCTMTRFCSTSLKENIPISLALEAYGHIQKLEKDIKWRNDVTSPKLYGNVQEAFNVATNIMEDDLRRHVNKWEKCTKLEYNGDTVV